MLTLGRQPHMQLVYGCGTERLQKACAVMENVCFAPHLSGARGQRWHMEPVSIPASTSEEGWNYLCCKKSALAFECACIVISQIHTIHHKISSPLHLSYSLHILSKSVAGLRLEPCPGSHSELHVSHYRHISTLYFANPRLLIKGQRASKKKCSSALTVTKRLLSSGK